MGRKALERVSQREYARRLNISNEAVSRAVKEGKIKKGWDAKDKKIIVEHANLEWGALHAEMVEAAPPSEFEKPETVKKQVPKDVNPETVEIVTLTEKASLSDAIKGEKINTTNLKALELKQKTGQLVNKDEVYKSLFAFGQQIRVSFLAIPDREIDKILAAKNRAEAHNHLLTAIHSVLEGLTKPQLDLTPRQ